MSESANVRAIHALEELRGALTRFSGEAQDMLKATQLEIERTTQWIEERANHWQKEIHHRQTSVDQARAALARCEASGYRDEQGRYHPPNCSSYEQALRRAQSRLQEATDELRNVHQWTKQINQAASEYQRQARQLTSTLVDSLPKGTALLSQKISTLQAYVSEGQITVHRRPEATVENPALDKAPTPETNPIHIDETKKPKPPEGWRPGGPERGK